MKKITKKLVDTLNKAVRNDDCRSFFEALDFNVYDDGNGQYEMSGVHTNGGVEMIISIEKDDWMESFREYCCCFDVDSEIDLYREDPYGEYCRAFSIHDSVVDFEAWEEYINQLLEIISADGDYKYKVNNIHPMLSILMFKKDIYNLDKLDNMDDSELINLSHRDIENVRRYTVDNFCDFVNMGNSIRGYHIKPVKY